MSYPRQFFLIGWSTNISEIKRHLMQINTYIVFVSMYMIYDVAILFIFFWAGWKSFSDTAFVWLCQGKNIFSDLMHYYFSSLQGSFQFSYSRGHGVCDYPKSSISQCSDASKLVFRYQVCTYISEWCIFVQKAVGQKWYFSSLEVDR